MLSNRYLVMFYSALLIVLGRNAGEQKADRVFFLKFVAVYCDFDKNTNFLVLKNEIFFFLVW